MAIPETSSFGKGGRTVSRARAISPLALASDWVWQVVKGILELTLESLDSLFQLADIATRHRLVAIQAKSDALRVAPDARGAFRTVAITLQRSKGAHVRGLCRDGP
jgi:hypothetical protein